MEAQGVPQSLEVLPGAGDVHVVPPTFLERWGVVFVAWILLISTAMLVYFVLQRPALPSLAGLSAEQIRGIVEAHKFA